MVAVSLNAVCDNQTGIASLYFSGNESKTMLNPLYTGPLLHHDACNHDANSLPEFGLKFVMLCSGKKMLKTNTTLVRIDTKHRNKCPSLQHEML
jgi:hypothetical protein